MSNQGIIDLVQTVLIIYLLIRNAQYQKAIITNAKLIQRTALSVLNVIRKVKGDPQVTIDEVKKMVEDREEDELL